MEFKGNYTKYANQFKQIRELLTDSSIAEFTTQLQKSGLSRTSFNSIDALNGPWENFFKELVFGVLSDISEFEQMMQSRERILGSKSLDFTRSVGRSDLAAFWGKLQKIEMLPELIKAVSETIEQLPEDAKKTPAVQAVIKMLDKESDFGHAFYTMSQKLELSFTNLTCIGSLDDTEKIVKIYQEGSPSLEIKVHKELSDKYEQAVSDYENKISYYYNDKVKSVSLSEEDAYYYHAIAEKKRCDNDLFLVDNDEYRKSKSQQLNERKNIYLKNLEAKSECSDKIKKDKIFLQHLDGMQNLAEDLKTFQNEHMGTTPEVLREEIISLEKIIAKEEKALANSQEKKNYDEAKANIDNFKKSNKSIRKFEEKMGEQIYAAKEIIDELGHISRNKEVKFIINAISQRQIKQTFKMSENDYFKMVLKGSVAAEDMDKMVNRIHMYIEGVKAPEDITLDVIRQFAKIMTGENFKSDSDADYLFDGIIPYVKMLEIEGMNSKPTFVKNNAKLGKKIKGFSEEEIRQQLYLETSSLVNQQMKYLSLKQQQEMLQERLDQIIKAEGEKIREDGKKDALYTENNEIPNIRQTLESQIATLKKDFAEVVVKVEESKAKLIVLSKDNNYKPEMVKTLSKKLYPKNSVNIETLIGAICNEEDVTLAKSEKILTEYIASTMHTYNEKKKISDASTNIKERFEKPLLEEIRQKLVENPKMGEDGVLKLCKEALTSSIELLKSEGMQNCSVFDQYLELKETEKTTLEALNKPKYSLELKTAQENKEKAEKELKIQTVDQKQYVDQLIENVKYLLEENIEDHILPEDRETILKGIKEEVEKFENKEHVTNDDIAAFEKMFNALRKSADDQLKKRQQEYIRIGKEHLELSHAIDVCKPEYIEHEINIKREAAKVANEHANKAEEIHLSKQLAIESKRALYDEEQQISALYSKEVTDDEKRFSTQLNKQIDSFIEAKAKLPKRKMGEDSEAFSSMFTMLNNVKTNDNPAKLIEKLVKAKEAAQNYLDARSNDFKWLFWKKSGKTAAGEARLNLANDIIQFCDSQMTVIANLQLDVVLEIKENVVRARAEKSKLKDVPRSEENVILFADDLEKREQLRNQAIKNEAARQKREQLNSSEAEKKSEVKEHAVVEQINPQQLQSDFNKNMIQNPHVVHNEMNLQKPSNQLQKQKLDINE